MAEPTRPSPSTGVPHTMAPGKVSATPSMPSASVMVPASPVATPAAQSFPFNTTLPGIIILIVLGGAFTLANTFFKDRLDRDPRRKIAIRNLIATFHGLEKRMSIARDFPGIAMQDTSDLQDLSADLQTFAASPDCAASLTSKEHAAVLAAVERCSEETAVIVSIAGNAARLTDVSDAARRALKTVYVARKLLKDLGQLKWPADPSGLWDPNSNIPQNEDDLD